jgi:RNA polymerase sigma-70 factor, ECF subfamily
MNRRPLSVPGNVKMTDPMEDTADTGPADDQLLARYRAGDRDAFAALYRRYAGPLHFYIRSLARGAGRAEDIVQEVFLRVLYRPPAEIRHPIKPYLYAAAANLVRDERRRDSVRKEAPPGLLPRPGASPAPAPELAEEVAAALDRLPDEQREVVALKVFAGLTFAEIESVTGAALGTVMSRYRYAVERLAQEVRRKE